MIDLVLEEMSAIRDSRPVSGLAKFVSYNVGRFGLSLETSQSVLDLSSTSRHGLPEDSLDTYRGLRAVDLETVHTVTRKRLDPERAAIVVLGPAADIVPQLDSLGEVEIW